MIVHVTHDGAGKILSVNRTVDGLAHFLAGHGDNPTLATGEEFSIEALDAALQASPISTVAFTDTPDLIVERHAVLV